MKTITRMFAVGMLLLCSAVAADAAQLIAGNAPGGLHPTVLTNKQGRIVGPMVDGLGDFTVQLSLTDTTVTALKAAPIAGSKVCLTFIEWEGVATTTAVTLSIKDGATLKFLLNVPAGASQRYFPMPTPMCGTAATAMNAVLSGAPTGAVQVNGGGYVTQ